MQGEILSTEWKQGTTESLERNGEILPALNFSFMAISGQRITNVSNDSKEDS